MSRKNNEHRTLNARRRAARRRERPWYSGWWPGLLRPIARERPLFEPYVVLGAIDDPIGPHSYRTISAVLLPSNDSRTLLGHRGGLGFEVESSGPFPIRDSTDSRPYQPWFRVQSLGAVEYDLEPLVESWRS